MRVRLWDYANEGIGGAEFGGVLVVEGNRRGDPPGLGRSRESENHWGWDPFSKRNTRTESEDTGRSRNWKRELKNIIERLRFIWGKIKKILEN